ncbi:MAG: NAD(P)/FAD-dependent oxidoreductase [Longimicrobiales bacterium]|nr:NAD(P)/FAD-dependent oxidoreductase [Longimicrobiales bacterium]
MHDVVIMGGGPAGLTLGCYLANAGLSPLVLEKLNHPRPHVGESLMPSALRVLREIGFGPVMEDAGFPRSGGVVYRPPRADDVVLPYPRFPGGEDTPDHTYHVDRARFDMLLMKHAENRGCRIVQGVGVEEVLFHDDGAARGVRVLLGGRPREIDARVVVDAAGRATRIGRQLGIRRSHPVLDQFALHAWFVDVDRGPERTRDYTNVYFLPELRGWAWHAPINDEITSIGVVASRSMYQGQEGGVEAFFREALAINPKLSAATSSARRINDLKGEVNYSYSLERVCGPGWLAIGDAARFLDPVFSSGVSVAVHSARFAAERIRTALESGDVRREVFFPYEDMMLSGAALWDDFIRLFYRLLPSFTELVQSQHGPAILRMIQGETYDDSDTEWLGEMRAMVRRVEEADTHPWKGELMDLPLATDG